MRDVIALVGLLALCACQIQQASKEPFADMWRPNDSRFSPREREVIAAARGFLEKEKQKPIDGYYKVHDTKNGYEIFVMFAAGYEDGRPLFFPGGHGTVVLNKDLSFVNYMPGECERPGR